MGPTFTDMVNKSSMAPNANYVLQPGGWGEILFLVWIPSVSASALALVPLFISIHYLLNQLMYFKQTCIDTLLGKGKKLIIFVW